LFEDVFDEQDNLLDPNHKQDGSTTYKLFLDALASEDMGIVKGLIIATDTGIITVTDTEGELPKGKDLAPREKVSTASIQKALMMTVARKYADMYLALKTDDLQEALKVKIKGTQSKLSNWLDSRIENLYMTEIAGDPDCDAWDLISMTIDSINEVAPEVVGLVLSEDGEEVGDLLSDVDDDEEVTTEDLDDDEIEDGE